MVIKYLLLYLFSDHLSTWDLLSLGVPTAGREVQGAHPEVREDLEVLAGPVDLELREEKETLCKT